MDGGYNFGCAGHGNNDNGYLGDDLGCRGSAQQIFELFPNTTQHIFNTGIGNSVKTGSVLTDCAPSSNPCRQAYFDWGQAVSGKGEHFNRPSWDLVNTLIAVRGVNSTYVNETLY